MGWYKQSCPNCWDHHEGTCEDYQRQRAQATAAYQQQKQAQEQTELLREQNRLLRKLVKQ